MTKTTFSEDMNPIIKYSLGRSMKKMTKRDVGKEILEGLEEITKTNPKDLMGSQKAPLSLVTYECVKGIAKAMYYGAFLSKRKDGSYGYGPYNWRQTQVRLSIYLDATLRHTFALASGEDKDPDSGLPHEYHIAANMNVILDAKKAGTLIDDRLDKRDK